MSKFLQQTSAAYKFYKDKNAQKNYNDEIVNKTWHYQKKFGFETSLRKGHEFWNNEADAFKHAYSGADMYFKYGDKGSFIGGIYHENQTPNNPQGEWNMDSWNNNQGRQIAKEIQKEYGDNFMKLPQQQQSDIIAEKVMNRMRNGQLITNPNDKRRYTGVTENIVNGIKRIQETNLPFTPTRGVGGVDNNGKPLGFAADIDIAQLANMLGIQSAEVQSTNQSQQSSLFGYTNPLTGSNHIYTREEVGSMSSDEFSKHKKEIDAQIKSFNGTMPTNRDLQREAIKLRLALNGNASN
jgi:hypothetical protein